ncbi:MAG: HEAT repeat domain-containing protein [Candidatus Gastranaerophilales bacterium]|nr:HEAT repeat domain-containing protein [Candidatus Gastranaerophilales bacterium]
MIQPTNMQYPQQGGANAVSINIYNPQAYGGTSMPAQAQGVPYNYTNSLYQMPQGSVYAQAMPVHQGFAPQYMPMTNPILQQQYVAPAPQAMPESVMAAPQVQPQAPQAQAEAPQVQPEAPTAQVAAVEATPVEIVEPQQVAQTVDVDSLIQNLKSADANVKAQTINQIATYAQDAPEIALQVVSEPVMQALVSVINEDTTGLQGPTAEQIAVAEKINKGEQLTPEEDALAEQLSPRDMANKNRIFALYTLAMIQKLQRDELNQYIEAQKANGQEPIAPLNVQDLVGYENVINVIQNDARPEVKVAAIQALQHVVEPQDKATVEPILTQAQASNDEGVKAAAAEAMTKFAAV